MMRKCLLFFILFIGLKGFAQDIVNAEYWFDANFDDRTTIDGSSEDLILNESIDLTGVEFGLHSFHIRAKNSIGKWSTISTKLIFVNSANPNIIAYEYWFDEGFENRITVSQNFDQIAILEETIEISSLSDGFHALHLRSKNESGHWSNISSKFFFCNYSNPQISSVQYWIDSDFENRITLSGLSQEVLFLEENASLQSTNLGLHTLNLRSKNESGEWSIVSTKEFVKSNGSDQIVKYEYWFGDNFQSKISLNIDPSELVFLEDLELPIVNSPKIDVFHFRVQNSAGNWSGINSRYVALNSNQEKEITKLRIWLDDDLENIYEDYITYPMSVLDWQPNYNMAPLDINTHTLHIQFMDSDGKWSTAVSRDFFYNGPSDAQLFDHPTLVLSNVQLEIGDQLLAAGHSYTPSGDVLIQILGDQFDESISIVADGNGQILLDELINNDMLNGQYSITALDVSTNKKASRGFVVVGNFSENTKFLDILSPFENEVLYTNQLFKIEIFDFLNSYEAYPINGINREYSYTLEYSFDFGPWIILDQFSGIGNLNSENYLEYEHSFSNVGEYSLRIRDNYNSLNSEIVSPIQVISDPQHSTEVSLAWDQSYNGIETNNEIRIKGISADGVSRMIFQLENNQTQIESVSISLSDDGLSQNQTTQYLGKLYPATNTLSYNNEANAANATDLQFSNISTNFIEFWYVAPDEFVRSAQEYLKNQRSVNVNFNINLENGQEEEFSRKIFVVRPPLVLAHGLGGSKYSWSKFKESDGNLLLYNQRFKQISNISLLPDVKFDENAHLLCYTPFTPSQPLQSDLHKSFVDVIMAMRNKGFVANRADYVGHSMGGVLARHASGPYSDMFNRTGQYDFLFGKNYESGFINKLITLNSPHNGSMLADIGDRYVDKVPFPVKASFRTLRLIHPDHFLFSLIHEEAPNNPFNYDLVVSPAVKNLKIEEGEPGELGGINHQLTDIPSHLIHGDWLIGNQETEVLQIPQNVITSFGNSEKFFKFLSNMNKILKIANVDIPEVQDNLEEILPAQIEVYESLSKYSFYAQSILDVWNLSLSVWNSDLLVSTSSQLATYGYFESNTSVISPAIHCCMTNKNILAMPESGDAVISALNEKIFDTSKYNILPQTNNFVATDLPDFNSNAVVISEIDTSEFRIFKQLEDVNASVDSIVDILAFIEDSTDLIEVEFFFQDLDYAFPKFQNYANIELQVTPNVLGKSLLIGQAYFKYGQDTLQVYYDTLSINVIPNSTLMNFQCNEDIIYIMEDQSYYPGYFAIYENFMTPVSNFSSNISASVQDPLIAEFDPIYKTFKGLNEGITHALITYENFQDTLYIVVQNRLETDSVIVDFIPEPLENKRDSQAIKIFPNPASNSTQIEFELMKAEPLTIRVFDVTGKILRNEAYMNPTSGKNLYNLNISDINSGTYSIEIKGQNILMSGKLIVN